MCLGVPMQITELRDDKAVAQLGGVLREISLMLIEDVHIGDYVLVHAGFGMSIIDEETANETIALLEEKYREFEEFDEGTARGNASSTSEGGA